MKKIIIALLVVVLVGVSTATIYHFLLKTSIKVKKANLEVSPKSLNIELVNGSKCVKTITIKNNGDNETRLYFDYIVEGNNPDKISVVFHRINGSTITSSNKLIIPAKGEVKVNVHINVEENTDLGGYTVYIMAKD
jgi:uncharacterized membrane protein